MKKNEEQAAVTRAMSGQEDSVASQMAVISEKVAVTHQPAGGRESADKSGSGQDNPDKDFSCDQCSYMGKSRKGLKNPVTKKHRHSKATEATEGKAPLPNEDKCPFCSFTTDPIATEYSLEVQLKAHAFHENRREFSNGVWVESGQLGKW